MRVGFVNISGKQSEKPFGIDPLVPLYLLTILEEELVDRLKLSYIDLRGVEEDSLIYHIPELDICLHYVTTPEIAEIQRIITLVRRIYPKALHLAGGPHTNIFPERREPKIFDAICIGEGEEIIANHEIVQTYIRERKINF